MKQYHKLTRTERRLQSLRAWWSDNGLDGMPLHKSGVWDGRASQSESRNIGSAMQAGWEYVQGVEITDEYLPIAQARAEYWTEKEAQKQLELEL